MKHRIKIRVMFTCPVLKAGITEGFTPVNVWGWARSDKQVAEEIERVKKDLSEIEREFDGEIEFEGWDMLHVEDDILEKSYEIQTGDIDGVIVFGVAQFWGYLGSFYTFNKPIIFFGREYTEPPYGFNLLTEHINWILKSIGKQGWACTVVDSYEKLKKEIRAIRAFAKLKKAKVICIGKPNEWKGAEKWGNYRTIRIMQEKTGINVKFISLDEIEREYEKMEETENMKEDYQKFLQSAESQHDLDEDSARNAVKFYYLMRKIVEDVEADAVTINCYATNLIDRIGTTPCYALARLNDEGIIAACEADFSALFNMMMVSYLTDKPCFMGDAVYNEERCNVINAHCSCPTKLSGYKNRGEPYIATSHYESEKGLTPQVIMKKGQEITITLLPTNMESMVIAKGVITDVNMGYPMCRTQVEFKVENFDEFLKACEDNINFFEHMVNVYGDHREEVARLCRLLGLNPIII